MTNNIVDIPCREIRGMARQTLRGKWLEAFAATVLIQVILTVDALIPESIPSIPRFLLTMIATIAAGPATYGLELYFLKLFRGRDEGMKTAFEGFRNVLNSFVLYALISIFTLLWAMLFIIPGIIAAYRYSMSYKVMADHPEYPPLMCIAESRRIMMGNKMKLFKLNLSFIGWAILASAPANYIVSPLIKETMMSVNTVEELMKAAYEIQFPPLVYLAMIPVCLLQVYIMTSSACFYDLAAGNLIIRNEGGYVNG